MPVTSQRFVCVHGHFYQPPRENPWLGVVEAQDSAAPFHDWNERITNECYAPNGQARVLNERKKIARIVNNYARMSYNFGPTLLSWLEKNAPRVYRSILHADAEGAERFSGHGPAMAQVYNHMIMPLANQRDRNTQIVWGIADFERRFRRKPEGMWLAETAVDRETLDLLAQHGIKFVVLAPRQCKHIRGIPKREDARTPGWKAVTEQTLDTRIAYRVPLDAGRSIAAFFYDGKISQAVAFEGLLNSGDKFAARLLGGFRDDDSPQLVHIATDGESYGHHHRHGEMALAYAVDKIERTGNTRVTVYAEFLEIAPPRFEAEVVEPSAWSCFHGVERWRSDCGCSSQRPGWNQKWRTPLRNALDVLRDSIAELAAPFAATVVRNLDLARNAYISVVLDRSDENTDAFLAAHAIKPLDPHAQTQVLRLMELEHNAMLMYTSCGWFFDDISGIETVQILAYAARVLQLAETLFGADGKALEQPFLEELSHALSNLPERGDGARIYLTEIKPHAVKLEQAAAHSIIGSLFPQDAHTSVDAYAVTEFDRREDSGGRARFVTGRDRVQSRITRAGMDVEFAVIHFGDQNLSAAVQPATLEKGKFAAFAAAAHKAFQLGDLAEVVRLMDASLGRSTYSLHSLFKDEQRRILGLLTHRTVAEVEAGLRAIYGEHTSILHFLGEAHLPVPAPLQMLSQFVTGSSLALALERKRVDLAEVGDLLERVQQEQTPLDEPRLSYAATQRAKRELMHLQAGLADATHVAEAVEDARKTIAAIRLLPFDLNLWQAQNIWYECRPLAAKLVPPAGQQFLELGRLLEFAVEELPPASNSQAIAE